MLCCCSAWFRLKLNTKIGLHTTTYPPTHHHKLSTHWGGKKQKLILMFRVFYSPNGSEHSRRLISDMQASLRLYLLPLLNPLKRGLGQGLESIVQLGPRFWPMQNSEMPLDQHPSTHIKILKGFSRMCIFDM